MKPHRTLCSMLVHPKDKLLLHQKSEAIYEIHSADCPKSYIGETGRSFGTPLQEHQKEVEKFELKPYTRSSRKSSVAEQHKSAITDHVVQTNHNIKWESAKGMPVNSATNQFGLSQFGHKPIRPQTSSATNQFGHTSIRPQCTINEM